MRRSLTRSSRCCQRPRGRSENRIFGNCVFPKNCANQVSPGFVFPRRFLLLQKPPVGGLEVLLGVSFGLSASLREDHEGTADGEMTFLGDAPHFSRQRRRDGNALANGPGSESWGKRLGLGSHMPHHAPGAPLWFTWKTPRGRASPSSRGGSTRRRGRRRSSTRTTGSTRGGRRRECPRAARENAWRSIGSCA